jgi:threonyl-tRNA synthetase
MKLLTVLAIAIPYMINSLLFKTRFSIVVKTSLLRTTISTQLRSTSTATKATSTSAVKDSDLFTIDLPTNENSDNLLRIRHSTAHVMAMAVQRLHPKAKVTIGPWIENG